MYRCEKADAFGHPPLRCVGTVDVAAGAGAACRGAGFTNNVGSGPGEGAAAGGRGVATVATGCVLRGAGAGVGAGAGRDTTVGCGAGEGCRTVRCVGAGLAVVARGTICSTCGATGAAACVCAPLSEGLAPQICRLSRDTRGTHVTFPSMPARMKMQPWLSTYWLPVNDAGGNSAGTWFCA